jgi:hypothetical protein
MNSTFTTLLTSYLLMPILAMVMGFIAFFVAKRNKLLSNRKLIFYVLLMSVILCAPALLGFIPYVFMPYLYIALQALYILAGYYGVIFLRKHLPNIQERKNPFLIIFLFQFLVMFIAAALFSTVFNLCSELKYGIWASTCLLAFIFPLLFWETFNKYMIIPPEIFKTWSYAKITQTFSASVDYDRLLVMEIELYKTPADTVPIKIKAKAPDNISFGVWFKMFLVDYNYKFPREQIEFDDPDHPYSWIFYVKRSFFLPRKYIDHDLTVVENRVKEKHTILAKRVSEVNNQDIK